MGKRRDSAPRGAGIKEPRALARGGSMEESMRLKLTVLNVLFIFWACGCASMLPDVNPEQYSVQSRKSNLPDVGIVFGQVTRQEFVGINALIFANRDVGEGPGIGIRKLNDTKIISYYAARNFSFKLPEGEYELYSVGTPEGSLVSGSTPFRFQVKAGEISYIGSMVSNRDIKRHYETLNIDPDSSLAKKQILAYRQFGLYRDFWGQIVSPFVDFYIIDRRDEAVQSFLKRFPQFEGRNIRTEFLK